MDKECYNWYRDWTIYWDAFCNEASKVPSIQNELE